MSARFSPRGFLCVRLASFLGVVVLIGITSGCAAKKGDVSGKVLFSNQPLPWGRITFFSQVGDKKVGSSVIRNGAYAFKDFPAGAVKVSIESFKAEKRNNMPSNNPMTKGFTPPNNPDTEPPAEAIGKHVVLPVKYNTPESSGLEYTIQPGSQNHDFNLSP